MITKKTTTKAVTKKTAIAVKEKPKTGDKKPIGKYFEAVGRRKTAISRVRIWPASGNERQITVNGKVISEYWHQKELQDIFMAPFSQINNLNWKVSVKILGGGQHSQAEASRHGLSRALVLAHPEYKKILKVAGFLTRDPRMKERKKPGLKGARRAPQWSKR